MASSTSEHHMHETLDILSDETLDDLRQSREDFTHGDVFDAEHVRAELAARRSGAA
jgi:hypothetical protein